MIIRNWPDIDVFVYFDEENNERYYYWWYNDRGHFFTKDILRAESITVKKAMQILEWDIFTSNDKKIMYLQTWGLYNFKK